MTGRTERLRRNGAMSEWLLNKSMRIAAGVQMDQYHSAPVNRARQATVRGDSQPRHRMAGRAAAGRTAGLGRPCFLHGRSGSGGVHPACRAAGGNRRNRRAPVPDPVDPPGPSSEPPALRSGHYGWAGLRTIGVRYGFARASISCAGTSGPRICRSASSSTSSRPARIPATVGLTTTSGMIPIR
jgi:hypothetical protein